MDVLRLEGPEMIGERLLDGGREYSVGIDLYHLEGKLPGTGDFPEEGISLPPKTLCFPIFRKLVRKGGGEPDAELIFYWDEDNFCRAWNDKGAISEALAEVDVKFGKYGGYLSQKVYSVDETFPRGPDCPRFRVAFPSVSLIDCALPERPQYIAWQLNAKRPYEIYLADSEGTEFGIRSWGVGIRKYREDLLGRSATLDIDLDADGRLDGLDIHGMGGVALFKAERDETSGWFSDLHPEFEEALPPAVAGRLRSEAGKGRYDAALELFGIGLPEGCGQRGIDINRTLENGLAKLAGLDDGENADDIVLGNIVELR